MSDVGGWTMGYYDTSTLQLWQWAREFTLADRFFQGAFGGSYLNHQYLVCACAPARASGGCSRCGSRSPAPPRCCPCA